MELFITNNRIGRLIVHIVLLMLFMPSVLSSNNNEAFEESLWVKSLPSGHIYTRMDFEFTDSVATRNPNHTRLFPRALLEILNFHKVYELHYSLTQGYWRLESWGDLNILAPTGAQISAWFAAENEESADSNWKGLNSRLSGLTCASLNVLDKTTSIEPIFAYRPNKSILKPSPRKLFLRVGNLPRENICTENLTPWTKLLPCGITSGISSLLKSKQLFNSHYHSASIEYYRLENEIRLHVSLSIVIDRPQNSNLNKKIAETVFGSLAISPCHLSKTTNINIWNVNGWDKIQSEDFNSLKIVDIPTASNKKPNLVFTSMKYMGGYGQEYGEIIVEMTNHLKEQFLNVLYIEVLPWYIRPYLHSLRIEETHRENKSLVPAGKMFHYTPGQDRKRLHKLELDLVISPLSAVTVKFMVEKGHLKWDEYPPDANHGFYLPAARFEVNVTKETDPTKVSTQIYYSRILLINLSTPDFSMPYFVMILTWTVVVLAFCPIHSITTIRFPFK